jgi:hypothetical protein
MEQATIVLYASYFQAEGCQGLWESICQDLGVSPDLDSVTLHIPQDDEHIIPE